MCVSPKRFHRNFVFIMFYKCYTVQVGRRVLCISLAVNLIMDRSLDQYDPVDEVENRQFILK